LKFLVFIFIFISILSHTTYATGLREKVKSHCISLQEEPDIDCFIDQGDYMVCWFSANTTKVETSTAGEHTYNNSETFRFRVETKSFGDICFDEENAKKLKSNVDFLTELQLGFERIVDLFKNKYCKDSFQSDDIDYVKNLTLGYVRLGGTELKMCTFQ
jgi:hypothetical protein